MDNIPIVNADRKQRLVDRLRQEFERAGVPIGEDRIDMPWDEDAGTNKG